ncbi:MAG: transglutaminase-like cysteine peptidase [bacterium]
MKAISTVTIAILAILNLPTQCPGQDEIASDEKAVFVGMLREFDLNEETQNGYAMTEAEYEQLKTAWQNLPQSARVQLLSGSEDMLWTGSFALLLLYDLRNDLDWQVHITSSSRIANHDLRGLSLTLSRFKNPMTLKAARKMLTDLLNNGRSMFREGRFELSEKIRSQAGARAGKAARQRLEKWQRMINEHQAHSDMEKAKTVNAFFNEQITAKADPGTGEGYDYWQSPVETLVRGIGDCDDFAMAKYISLRLLGIPADRLRVAVVKPSRSPYHAVLLFYPQNASDPWVLDNMTFEYNGLTESHILKLRARMIRQKMKPLWAINEHRVSEFERSGEEKVTDPNPSSRFPKFGMALANSRRVLPLSGRICWHLIKNESIYAAWNTSISSCASSRGTGTPIPSPSCAHRPGKSARQCVCHLLQMN